VLCAVALLGYVLVGRTPSPSPPAERPPGAARPPSIATTASHQVDGAALLTRLTRRLRSGSRASVLALAAPHRPAARRELRDLYANVHGLGVDDLSVSYDYEDADGLSAAQRRRWGPGAWAADARLRWRVRGYDAGVAQREVGLVLTERPEGAAFGTARATHGGGTPLWLLHRLNVARSRHSLVMTSGPGHAARVAAMADRSRRDVRQVLPGWHGRLVVEVPGSEAELDRTLGVSREAYAGIAAVTTTSDGSRLRTAPVHVFVNPPVFGELGPRAAQIVLTHEATHVATHAATSTMPLWLLEGFADYVALGHADLPVRVSASQILRQVRTHGVPSHLPGAQQFEGTSPSLGASYEAAWLACRLIAATYGQPALVELYRQVDRTGSTSGPFDDVLGTSEAAFTRAWQQYLRRLS